MGSPAARLSDMHICPKVEPGPVPHIGGPLLQGSADVLIGGMPAARVGDMALCVGPPDKVAAGAATVLINGKPAARMGDACAHGGRIVIGCPTVLVGDGGGGGGGGAGVAPTAAGDNGHLPPPPTTRAEALQRLEQAANKVRETRAARQPLPQSPYSTADKRGIVREGLKEKYIVRVIETKYAGDGDTIGYMPEGATTATYWTTTFTQLEHADTDAELIARAVGTNYDPEKSYTLLLIDQQQANVKGDMVSFIPTYENLGHFAQEELADEFQDREFLIEPAMTPEYSEAYERVFNTAETDGINLDDADMFNEHAKTLGCNEDQIVLLDMRHKMAKKLGANEQFLGNGMTKDNNADNPITPFGKPKVGQVYGPIETFTYDKNPRTLGKLEKAGIVTRIPLNNA